MSTSQFLRTLFIPKSMARACPAASPRWWQCMGLPGRQTEVEKMIERLVTSGSHLAFRHSVGGGSSDMLGRAHSFVKGGKGREEKGRRVSPPSLTSRGEARQRSARFSPSDSACR